jgi:hypothetical protein
VSSSLGLADFTSVPPEQAAAFYRRWGFVPVPQQPLKLYRRIKDIRRMLDG